MKSIRTKITLIITAITLVAVLLVGSVSSVMSLNATNQLLEQTVSETAKLAAGRVEEELNTYTQIAYEVGSMSSLSSIAVADREKENVINQRMEIHGFVDGGIIGKDGYNIFHADADYSSYEFFQKAMQGETAISDPIINPETGELTIIISAPLWKAGAPETEAVGAVYFVPDPNMLNNIVSSIKISQNGGAYIINSSGTTIAHQNMQVVMNQENTMEDAKSDKALATLAAMEQKMVNGESGFGTYTYGGVKKAMAYAPIANSGGWSIAVNAPMNDFTSDINKSVLITIILACVVLVIGSFVARAFAFSIGTPLKLCAQRLQDMAAGDLHSEVPATKSKDEISILLGAAASLKGDLEKIIGDVRYLMSEMAQGNFTVKTQNEEAYAGDFEEILTSMRGLRVTMDDTLRQIALASDQVDSGSDQVASGAQALSQGATEQASSVEELAATVNDINNHVHRTGVEANEASEKTTEAGKMMMQCDEQMKDMVAAMDEISHTSEEIGKIIKAIEDIAFQTNILALNAAVEAARAGSAGKGFAVVADEVRNLAAKSAEASQTTAGLIEAAMAAVANGAKIANGTADQLRLAAGSAQEVSDKVAAIAAAAQEQAASIEQVTTGIDQISAVVQTNSATAEESAAASEELSSQAQMLKDLIGRFKLEEVDTFSYTPVENSDYDYQPVYGGNDKF